MIEFSLSNSAVRPQLVAWFLVNLVKDLTNTKDNYKHCLIFWHPCFKHFFKEKVGEIRETRTATAKHNH